MPKLQEPIGHVAATEQLTNDVTSGNVSHAYLFTGPGNLGKMTTALWFAEQLLAVDSDLEKKDLQHQIERLTHPDLLVLDQLWIEGVCDDWDIIAHTSNAPQQHRAKKPGAKTDTISIDDIRALQQRLHETGIGTYRCCIIRSVERMQPAAANAFLKILEEPPQGLVFILTTESHASLLPTIISRARMLNFRRLSQVKLLTFLEGVADEDREFILRIAQGAPGIACKLRDDPDLLREHKIVFSKAASFWKTPSLQERLQILAPLHKRGEEAEQLLLHLSLALRRSEPKQTQVSALSKLARSLQSNAHRQLLSQQFAMASMDA